MPHDPRLAVLSDIHGNLEAFERVLEDMASLSVRRAVCLGDVIGYGPEPEACAATVLVRGIPTVLGNHEKGLADRQAREWFNPQSRRALEKTRALVTPETAAELARLPEYLVQDGVRFVHGAPPHAVTRYLFEIGPAEWEERFSEYPEQLCFAGHTHELRLYTRFAEGDVRSRPLRQGVTKLSRKYRQVVNAGSVGQPRDGDNHAKYVVYDPEAHAIDVRFVAYDIEKTAARIIELGMPRAYADRLR